MKNFIIKLLIFSIPIVIIFASVEYLLRNLEYSVTIKKEFFNKNKNDIKILALGSSHFERGINPKYLTTKTLNLGNSGQRIYENFELLKKFAPDLPNLNLVIVEMGYDWLERDKNFTSPIVDVQNLVFFNVNTLERKLKFEDYSIYLTDPSYFSHRIVDNFTNSTDIEYNQFGFEKTKYAGSFEAVGHIDSLILDKDIFIENVQNKKSLKRNTEIFNQFLKYCKNRNLQILIYNPPIHVRFNKLREKSIIRRRDSILNLLKENYPQIKVFNDEVNYDFEAKYFYNGDHLNPLGAKKSTVRLNDFLQQNYYFTNYQ